MGHHSDEADPERGLQPIEPIILQDVADGAADAQHEQIAADNVVLPPNELELDQIEQVRRESIELRVNPLGM